MVGHGEMLLCTCLVSTLLATSEGRDALVLPGKNPRLAGLTVGCEAALAALQ